MTHELPLKYSAGERRVCARGRARKRAFYLMQSSKLFFPAVLQERLNGGGW